MPSSMCSAGARLLMEQLTAATGQQPHSSGSTDRAKQLLSPRTPPSKSESQQHQQQKHRHHQHTPGRTVQQVLESAEKHTARHARYLARSQQLPVDNTPAAGCADMGHAQVDDAWYVQAKQRQLRFTWQAGPGAISTGHICMCMQHSACDSCNSAHNHIRQCNVGPPAKIRIDRSARH